MTRMVSVDAAGKHAADAEGKHGCIVASFPSPADVLFFLLAVACSHGIEVHSSQDLAAGAFKLACDYGVGSGNGLTRQFVVLLRQVIQGWRALLIPVVTRPL